MKAWRIAFRVAVARVKAARKGHPLPPGNFFRLEPLLAAERRGLVEKAANVGPLLTATWGSRVAICVVGLPTARRLLIAHADDLKPLSIVLDSIVPKGFLRMMEGDVHKRYRTEFSRAIRGPIVEPARSDILSIIHEGLRQFERVASSEKNCSPAMESMAAGLLLRTFLGVNSSSEFFDELKQNFLKMGPSGFVWKVGREQKAAFEAIRKRVLMLISEPQTQSAAFSPDSVLGRLKENKAVDETVIGNLIYMIEMGREDLRGFFSWIIHFLNQNPSLLDRIALGEVNKGGRSILEAIVLETLRMEQSERLMRLAKRDFAFDGFLFPKGSVVRICLWEPHKDSITFEKPYTFDADRFLKADFGIGQYAPFGLDQHHCPAADAMTQLAKLFVEAYGTDQIARRSSARVL